MRIDVLDCGYVQVVEGWGSDDAIISAARMSTSGGFVSWEAYEGHPKGDAGLLSYLWRNKHFTPFEFAGLVVEMQCPIFCLREIHRHRVFSYNEASARYAPLPDINYVPTVERVMRGGGHLTKQASGVNDTLSDAAAEAFIQHLEDVYARAEFCYQEALRDGVPKELARLCLPVGRYSKQRMSGNLRCWLGFLELREAPNAQWEIQEFARAIHSLLSERFPRTMKLYEGEK